MKSGLARNAKDTLTTQIQQFLSVKTAQSTSAILASGTSFKNNTNVLPALQEQYSTLSYQIAMDHAELYTPILFLCLLGC